MQDELKKYLQDILTAVQEILLFTKKVTALEDYSSNLLVKRAVERELEIIGEALNNALKIDENIAISNARKIVNTRNKIIHGYDEVEDAVVWAIIIKYLPVLMSEVEILLNKK